MIKDTNIHQHRAAAATAKPFPANDDHIVDFMRMVQELRSEGASPPKRSSTRFEVRGQKIVVTIMHPGGSLTANEGVLLDVSAGGAGFLYPGFVHHESVCVAHLHSLDGDEIPLAGVSVWCRFVSRNIHAIGVKWDEAADVRQFVTNRQWLEQVGNSDEIRNSTVKGTLLLVGFDEMEVDLMRVQLDTEEMELEALPDTGAAHDRIARGEFDAIFIDGDHPGMNARDLYNDLRTGGVHESITIVTGRPDGYEAWTETAGAAMLARPFSPDVLTGMLREQILMSSNPMAGSQPIYSSLPSDKQAAVETYISRLRQCGEQIEEAIKADNPAVAVRIAQTIQNTAEGYGFAILAEAASQSITAVNSTMSAAESAPDLRQLIRVLGRLRASRSQAA